MITVDSNVRDKSCISLDFCNNKHYVSLGFTMVMRDRSGQRINSTVMGNYFNLGQQASDV